MNAQVNIPQKNLAIFKEVAERIRVEIECIEVREFDTRFEIKDVSPASLFYLGTSYGMEVIHASAIQSLK
jgi:hypothetical protein